MLKILITRNAQENIELASEISGLGYQCLCYPMFSWEKQDVDLSSLERFQNVIITSSIAAQITSDFIDKSIMAWVVGAKTSAILSQNSHIEIVGTYNNISSLERNLPNIENRFGFIYLSGNYITQEIDNVKREIIYNTSYVSYLSSQLLDLILEVDVIMFYSYHNANNFLNLLAAEKCLYLLRSKKIITISKNIALLFNNIDCKLYYSVNNNNKEMLELLKCLKK